MNPPSGPTDAAWVSEMGDALEQADSEDAPQPFCPDVETWVTTIYVTTYMRKMGGQILRWCAQWWQHPEAIVRLTALWQTWEAARINEDPGAMADWIRVYHDGLTPVLLSADGPFNSCTPIRHADQTPMPTTLAPAGYWG